MIISMLVNGMFAVGWGVWCLSGDAGTAAWFALGFHVALTIASVAFHAAMRALR
jgi:hypothetical protein